jgi:putative FmdB family regulatory protein
LKIASVEERALAVSSQFLYIFHRKTPYDKESVMPTYEYRCKMCGYQFEVFQRISEEPVKKCPRCGKPVERMISAGMGIIFKGTGFYSTDYKKSKANDVPVTSSAGKGAKDSTKKHSKT